MSEYQYYEFLAIDRPLTPEEISALRALSTRAHITPVSFTNEYNWGSFSGDSDNLMERYFDAHVYVANWMTAIFKVRVPKETLSEMIVEAVSKSSYIPDFRATKTHWIITWRLEESENYDRFGMDDGRDWMVRLAPVRGELLRWDIRSLYIGWLSAVTEEIAEDDDLEPLSLEGLGELTEVSMRTVGKLLENAESAKKIRLERQKLEQKNREIKRRKEREVYLKALSKDFPKAWKTVLQSVERGSGLSYDEACRALADLSEAYSLHSSREIFQQELKKIMAGYMRRKALIQRLVKAGIWNEK